MNFEQIARQPNPTERKGATHDNSPLGGVGSYFLDFYHRYLPLFQLRTSTRNVKRIAEQYFKGLIQASKKNMERMAEAVPESNDQALQHFLTNSPWNDQPVVEQVAQDADKLLGGHSNSCFILDESGMPKKGDQSVGVARQWCGQLGKTDNCQVGVYSTLCRGEHAVLIGSRLYLPKSWVEDVQRCRKAGVPDDLIEFQRKRELALQLVIGARVFGVQFEWVGADSFYGKDPVFLRMLDQLSEIFMADVSKSQHIYLEDPDPNPAKPEG